MSKKEIRMKSIVDLLVRNGETSVKFLASELRTSEMTIRRYLDELESNGKIQRTHGGALPLTAFTPAHTNEYLMGDEIDKNVNRKNKIGFQAARLVNTNETVAFDIGTTVPFIAKYLANDIQISAISVTFKCASELYNKKNVNLIVPGGYLDRKTDVFQSDEGIAFLSKIRTDKVFISAGGIDLNLGLTCYHDFHVTIKKLFMKSSKKIVLVADSSKFGMVSPSHFGELTEIDTIITDEDIPDTYRKYFETKGIEIIVIDSKLNY